MNIRVSSELRIDGLKRVHLEALGSRDETDHLSKHGNQMIEFINHIQLIHILYSWRDAMIQIYT